MSFEIFFRPSLQCSISLVLSKYFWCMSDFLIKRCVIEEWPKEKASLKWEPIVQLYKKCKTIKLVFREMGHCVFMQQWRRCAFLSGSQIKLKWLVQASCLSCDCSYLWSWTWWCCWVLRLFISFLEKPTLSGIFIISGPGAVARHWLYWDLHLCDDAGTLWRGT